MSHNWLHTPDCKVLMNVDYHVGQLNSSSCASYERLRRYELGTKVYLAWLVGKHKLAGACMNAVCCVIELGLSRLLSNAAVQSQ